MRNNFFLIYLLLCLLSSCATQPPAPIEYNTPKKKSKKGSITRILSDDGHIIHQDLKDYSKEPTDYTELDRNIAELNLSSKSYRDTIKVDDQTHLSSQEIVHEVVEGESIRNIAKKYNISVNDLIKFNKLKPPYILEELQVLHIPTDSSNQTKKNMQISKADNQTTQDNQKSPYLELPTKLMMPVKGRIIAKFGEQMSTGKNKGINIATNLGSAVKSITDGIVVYSGQNSEFGNLVIIKSNQPKDFYIAYAHLLDLTLTKGENIELGKVIGHVGNTGIVKMPQLYLSIKHGKNAVDPLKYIDSTGCQ